jgi:glycosyltransferase involved in cell wall biosynthesis
MPQLKVLFFVEGFTDIRFVVGLSEIFELTMFVPARQYAESGLRERVAASGARVQVREIPGSRSTFQLRSLALLWKHAREFDVILSQEVLRGSVNANVVGKLRGVPVVTFMAIAPLEYFRCRRERRRIGALASLAGQVVIWTLMRFNGRMAARALALGPYLLTIAEKHSLRAQNALYYGVDTTFFRPADEAERQRLRRHRDLPMDAFLIFLASRISHEKDPETVLEAVSTARARGLNAVVINLGGGYAEFLQLAREMKLPDCEAWVLGRPAAHPMIDVADYFRAADVTAQASLAEGLGLSPLESLASGTPVVATNVGGMAQLNGYARLVPRGDVEAMAKELLWIAANPAEARAQALRGRGYVEREWSREKAFRDLRAALEDVAGSSRAAAGRSPSTR